MHITYMSLRLPPVDTVASPRAAVRPCATLPSDEYRVPPAELCALHNMGPIAMMCHAELPEVPHCKFMAAWGLTCNKNEDKGIFNLFCSSQIAKLNRNIWR